MAEFVTEKQERLLPEYELMKKLEICTDEQIKDFMQKRNSLQTKISQSRKTLRQFVDFIIFEKKVHKWICEKEKVLQKNLNGLRTKVAGRITALYREALRCFPAEERLWQNYIQFCKKSFPNDVTKVYEKMLSFHADKPALWCDAGLWIYQYNRNMPRVKDMFYRALQKHATSEAIYNAFFGILLLDISKMSWKRNLNDNTLSVQDVGMEALEILYRDSKSKIKNISYYLGLLDLCEKRRYLMLTVNLQKTILDDLMDMFARDERLWHALAKRELRGYNIDELMALKTEIEQDGNAAKEENTEECKANVSDDELEELQQHIKKNVNEADVNEISENEEDVEDAKVVEKKKSPSAVFRANRSPLNKRIEATCKVYKAAVSTLQTEKMWSLYINMMLHLNKNMVYEAVLKRKCLAQAFQDAHESGIMSVEHYNTYVRMLLETESGVSRAAKIMEEAVKRNSNAAMYRLWLTIHINRADNAKIEEIYYEAKHKLGIKDALPVIELLLEYYKAHNKVNLEKLEKLYSELCAQLKPEFGAYRADYLQFLFDNYDVKKTRLEYAELSKIPPPCLELHKKMSELEAAAAQQHQKDEKHWRLVHENSTYYFGKSLPDVWIDYLEFEKSHGDPRRVSNLHKRAVGALRPDLVDTFITKTSFMQVMIY